MRYCEALNELSKPCAGVCMVEVSCAGADDARLLGSERLASELAAGSPPPRLSHPRSP